MTAHLLLLLSAFLLALGSVLAKGLLSSGFGIDLTPLHPLVFLLAQLSGSLLLLIAVATARRRLVWNRALVRLALPGAIVGAGSICTILALYFMTASEASLIFATQPVIVLGLAWVFLRERVTWSVAVLVALAVLGVVGIVQSGEAGVSLNRPYGVAFAVISTSCAAIYVVWMRSVSGIANPMVVLISVQAVSLFVAIVAWVVWGVPGVSTITTASLSAASWTGAIYYGAAFLVYLYGLRTVEASKAGIYLNLVPLFTVVMAFAWLDEVLTPQQIGGGVLVIAAVASVAFISARTQKAS